MELARQAAVEELLKQQSYCKDQRGVWISGIKGYWSNLTKSENTELLNSLGQAQARDVIRRFHPEYEQIIFSEKRVAGLELLDIRPGAICIDYGCMWGGLAVGMAKRGATVLAIDQTYASLAFLARRLNDEGLSKNVLVAQNDIRKVSFPGLADHAIVNGVLEWVPETGEVELKNYYGKPLERDENPDNPESLQQDFLKLVARNLKQNGTLFLAIENRFDYTQFFGKRDPHANLLFTSFLPRAISNQISKAVLRRPYVNYLYSFPALKSLLHQAGFREIDLYMAFPDYRFPELILPYSRQGISQYRNYGMAGYSWKRKAATLVERALMKYFGARYFAPSIMAVAKV